MPRAIPDTAGRRRPRVPTVMSQHSAERTTDLEAKHLAFFTSRDPALRDELVAAYEGLARSLAARFNRRGEALDDLNQAAMLALVKALDRYDPTRGIQFSTFAWATVVGELKRHLRDRTWAMRVPRRVQERALDLTRAADDLTHDLGRSPTIPELAAVLGCADEEVVEALEANRAYRLGSLDAPSRDGDGARTTTEVPMVEAGIGRVDGQETVRALLARLPERQRRIVELRFFEDLTQAEIGARLGISQMHVSRLLARALTVLRTLAQP